MTIEDYPNGLIPQCGWKTCIQVADLIDVVPESVIARRLDGPKDLYVDDSLGEDNSFLRSDTFRDSSLIDMSVSLLGALLKVIDMRLRQTEEASNDWDGNEVDAANLVKKYVVESGEEWFCVSWLVRKIHAIEFPYKKNVDKKNFKTLKKNVEMVSGVVLGAFEEYLEQEHPLNATTFLSHKPTMLNYWHFTFNVRPADNEAFIKKTGRGWSDTLLSLISKELFRYNFSYATKDGVYPEIPSVIWDVK